jgi:cell division septation protein DedD
MKLKLILMNLFLTISIICAQAPGPKWVNVYELSDQIVYVDTSSIRPVSGQISVLSISVFKKPQQIPSLNQEALSVKNQVLFNVSLKKYTIIGTMYYDKNLKILGETSLPGFVSSGENFSTPISGNKIMTAVFNKAVEYLNGSAVLVDGQNSAENKEVKNTTTQSSENKIQKPKPITQQDTSSFNRVALYLSKKDSAQKAVVQPEQPPKNAPKIDTPKLNEREQKTTIPGLQLKETDGGNETNPRGTIFTDGSRYSFQVSSWKNRAKAESEVARLKKAGHNAFMTEGILKGVTWYRVRIGYFNSIEATEEYQRKLRNGN